MSQDRKESILNTARRLFGERGYNGVSMRDIADELGISVGNLTYHFKHKEDIIETIIVNQHISYRKGTVPETLGELNTYFQKLLNRQQENAYYFRHYTQLAQISEKIYQLQEEMIRNFEHRVTAAFGHLYQQGLIREDEIEGQTSGVIRALMAVCIYGTPLGGGERLPVIWSVIYPLLTEAGKAEYRKIF